MKSAEQIVEEFRSLRRSILLESMDGKMVIKDAGIMQDIVERMDAILGDREEDLVG